jgi:hypothetical protein
LVCYGYWCFKRRKTIKPNPKQGARTNCLIKKEKNH